MNDIYINALERFFSLFLLKLNFSLCEYKKGVFYLEKMYSNSLLNDKSNKFITFDRVK